MFCQTVTWLQFLYLNIPKHRRALLFPWHRKQVLSRNLNHNVAYGYSIYKISFFFCAQTSENRDLPILLLLLFSVKKCYFTNKNRNITAKISQLTRISMAHDNIYISTHVRMAQVRLHSARLQLHLLVATSSGFNCNLIFQIIPLTLCPSYAHSPCLTVIR